MQVKISAKKIAQLPQQTHTDRTSLRAKKAGEKTLRRLAKIKSSSGRATRVSTTMCASYDD